MKNRIRPELLPVVMILLMIPIAWAAGSPLDPAQARAFLEEMLAHPDSLDSFLHPADLKVARRLGISYPEAPCKPLISWDLSANDRERLLQVGLDGQFTVEPLDNGHSRLVLFPADSLATRSWVFRDGLVVSPILYQVRDWQQIDSPHFRFFVSDTTGFHPANIEALENFLLDTATQLGLTEADLERLAAEKIYYCFCSSPEEIRQLTGFEARGMYMVSHDIIVSTYSAHLHELAHLLMNFKLKRPHLYTHPLLLEGFAVAVGGRGGKLPAILQQLGLDMHRSGWVVLTEMLKTEGFYGYNASVSYPAAGQYNRFLLDNLGAADYLSLYARYGGDAGSIMTMEIDPSDLPEDPAWERYLTDQSEVGAITPGTFDLDSADGPAVFLPLGDGSTLGFAVPGTTLVHAGPAPAGYRSFQFEDLLPDLTYSGERYYIRASRGEAAVYDLFTNTMLALHATGFSAAAPEIPVVDGRFWFRVDRELFSDDLESFECRFLE